MELDFQIFHFINTDLANGFFDWIAPILREKKTWIPLYIVLLAWVIYRYKKEAIIFILLAIITVGLTDFTSSSIIKPIVKRIRPCNNPAYELQVRELVSCGGGYSFPSSHSANHFALAFFLGLTVFRKNAIVKFIGFFWALSIAFSQVYVGVHYPVDIFAGACWGILMAIFVFMGSNKIWPEYLISLQR